MRYRLDQLGTSKTFLGGLVAAVVFAVAGGTYGYAALSSKVTVSLEGESRQVTALGGTVGSVLEAEGIEVGKHDDVAPGLDEAIVDGTRISVRYGRPLRLSVDGQRQTHWVTATRVGPALGEIGRTFDKADLSVSRGSDLSRGGLRLEVVTAKTLKIKVGPKRPVTKKVAAVTVKESLRKLDIRVDKDDVVEPAEGKLVADGDKIVVTRIRDFTRKDVREAIDFRTVQREDDSALEGRNTVVAAGRDGVLGVTYRFTIRNGKRVSTETVRQRVLRKPVTRVIEIGTREKAPPSPPPSPPDSGGSTVWDALARCESGGNWAINTGNGYYGGLQFSLATWRGYGGAGLPHQQSRGYQIMIAERLRAATGGYGSWPHCSRSLGLPQ